MKSISLRAPSSFARAAQDARVLDLAEAAVLDRGGRRLVERLRRRRSPRRPGSSRRRRRSAACPGCPPRPENCCVYASSQPSTASTPFARSAAPVPLPAVLAEAGDGREQEREAGRGGGGVLDHEQVAVARLGEVLERPRRRDPALANQPPVDVEADLAVVDRRHVVVGVGELRIDVRELVRAVRVEQVAVERAREDAVVDPEDDVALRVAGGQQRAVQRLVRVAGLEDPQREPALLLERRLDRPSRSANESCVTSTTSVGASPPPPQPAAASAPRPRASQRRAAACDDGSRAPPDRGRARPDREEDAGRRRVTRASVAAKTFETPRLEPGSSVSPASG